MRRTGPLPGLTRRALALLGLGSGLGFARAANSRVTVILELEKPSVAARFPGRVDDASKPAREQYTRQLQEDQARVLAHAVELGGVEKSRATLVSNVVVVTIAAERVESLKAIPGVVKVQPARQLKHPPGRP